VPAAIRVLAPWASRYGVAQRAKLIRVVDARAREIHAWLDGFSRGTMTGRRPRSC